MSKKEKEQTIKVKVSKSKKASADLPYFVHPTAMIEDEVAIGEGTKIWHYAQVRRGTKLGKNCIIAKSVFIDTETEIGDNCKIQNHAIIYHKAIIDKGVFIGPNVCFTNDKIPRAINPDGSLKSADDWQVTTIHIGEGAAIGAHSVITPGVTIGKFAMAGSGSVITKDVPDFALVFGNPARIHEFVCKCGSKLNIIGMKDEVVLMKCPCGIEIEIPEEVYLQKMQKPGDEKKKRVWLR